MVKNDSDIINSNIIWNSLISVCEEQANSLLKAAFGPIVREAGDLSAGVFDRKYNMIAQAITGTPGHVNTMAKSLNEIFSKLDVNSIREGDVLITNDPWIGAGHLFDFIVVTPVFKNDQLINFFASTCHITDVGGLGWSAEAKSVFEEGTLIPVSFLRRSFQIQEELLSIICTNSRVPKEARGDILSLMSCNDSGVERLNNLLNKFELVDLDIITKFIFKQSKNAVEARIKSLPTGTYLSTLKLDGFDKPIVLKAKLKIKKKSISVDLSGSSPAINRGINCPLNYTIAYASYGIKAAICPEVPNNAASLAVIQITAPPGLIVSAESPSPVTARHVVGQALPDLVLGCLSKALPGKILAESAGALWTISIAGAGEKRFNSLNVALGGMGARPQSDGLSTTAFPSGVGAVSVEVAEAAAPVIYHKKEFLINSGGSGKFRGGLGQEIIIGTSTNEPFILSAAAFERTKQGPAGRNGGLRGGKGEVSVSDGTKIKDKGNYLIKKGETIRLVTPGGGGFGKAKLRNKKLQDIDVKNGLTTEH